MSLPTPPSRSLSPECAAALADPHGSAVEHRLAAAPETCFWGYFDRDEPAVLEVRSGDTVTIEALSHHAGDAPDLMMDDAMWAVWSHVPEAERAPGVHIMTGPIHVAEAEPGDSLLVRILDMAPRTGFGSNCAANWGLLYDTFGKERITIYELTGARAGSFGATARPIYGFDFTSRDLYDLPGVLSSPSPEQRTPFSQPVEVPVRPHFGVMGVAPPDPGRHSSVPPGRHGGNVDNWRLGPGSAMVYPVFAPGAGLYVGDPHFAQGDGEICGTAIEASINARLQVLVIKDVSVTSPVLLQDSSLITHGFGSDLDGAMRMAAEQMLWVMTSRLDLSADDAYSLCSVGVDFGITQVVDSTLGCHGILDVSIFG